jgi:hypothetical protein
VFLHYQLRQMCDRRTEASSTCAQNCSSSHQDNQNAAQAVLSTEDTTQQPHLRAGPDPRYRALDRPSSGGLACPSECLTSTDAQHAVPAQCCGQPLGAYSLPEYPLNSCAQLSGNAASSEQHMWMPDFGIDSAMRGDGFLTQPGEVLDAVGLHSCPSHDDIPGANSAQDPLAQLYASGVSGMDPLSAYLGVCPSSDGLQCHSYPLDSWQSAYGCDSDLPAPGSPRYQADYPTELGGSYDSLNSQIHLMEGCSEDMEAQQSRAEQDWMQPHGGAVPLPELGCSWASQLLPEQNGGSYLGFEGACSADQCDTSGKGRTPWHELLLKAPLYPEKQTTERLCGIARSRQSTRSIGRAARADDDSRNDWTGASRRDLGRHAGLGTHLQPRAAQNCAARATSHGPSAVRRMGSRQSELQQAYAEHTRKSAERGAGRYSQSPMCWQPPGTQHDSQVVGSTYRGDHLERPELPGFTPRSAASKSWTGSHASFLTSLKGLSIFVIPM